MLLFNLFLRLHAQTPTTSTEVAELEQFSHQMLTPFDLDFAYKKITSAYREAPSLHTAYDRFLMHCRDALGKQNQTSMFHIMIDYLTELHVSPEESKTHIQIIVALFHMHLHEQTNALSIAPLGRCFVDSPKVFAAFLQWLMQHDVSPDKILQTHLLQDYFRYHLSSLNTPENPIRQLYTLLNYHIDTAILVEKSTKTRCPEEGLASYTLDGTTHAHEIEALDNPSLKIPDFELTQTVSNVKALYGVFGVPFLVGVLRWYADENHPTIQTSILIALFNNKHIAHKDFTLLLQHLREHQHLQKKLATLLLDATFDELIETGISGLSRLILYSDYLTHKINAEDLATYIDTIKQASPSHLDLIADLSALLNTFKKHNPPHALLAFNHLVDVILEHPDVLDDDNMLRQLRRFKPGKKELEAKSMKLENDFNQMLISHTNTSLEAFDYISIEDLWRTIHRKLDAIQTIENISNTFPSDKYKLQCRLLKAFLPQLNITFVLDDFIQQLGIPPDIDDHTIMPYERLLLEMLVSLDDENLRRDLMHRLETYTTRTRAWYDIQFDDRSLCMHAAHHGNLGLIMWLKSQHIKQPESYEKLTRAAVDAKHWPVVHYFHQTTYLNHPVVDDLLKLAVEQDAPEAILPLWQGKKSAPRLPMVERCCNLAAKTGRVNCLKALLSCPMPPCDTSITKAYKIAIQTQHIALIHVILSVAETQHLPCLNQAIAQERRRKKLPLLVGVKSCDNFLSSDRLTKNQEALAQHGLFKKKSKTAHSYNNLALPPLSPSQTCV